MLAKSNGKGAVLPPAPYEKIATTILGARYELSVAAVTPAKARSLNKQYREKSYTPDVLAFPLGKNEGEIILNTNALAREAKKHHMKVAEFTAYIFMHACVHLSGHRHGSAMDKKETHFAEKLGIKTPIKDR